LLSTAAAGCDDVTGEAVAPSPELVTVRSCSQHVCTVVPGGAFSFVNLGPLNGGLLFMIEDGELGKSLASQHRLKVLIVDWPVVALAAIPTSDGYWSVQVGQESGVPEPFNSTQQQHNADATTQEATAQRYASLGQTSVRWPTLCKGAGAQAKQPKTSSVRGLR